MQATTPRQQSIVNRLQIRQAYVDMITQIAHILRPVFTFQVTAWRSVNWFSRFQATEVDIATEVNHQRLMKEVARDREAHFKLGCYSNTV